MLKVTPKMTFAQLASQTGIKDTTVKAVLNRLFKGGVLDREKVAAVEKPKAGPTNVYVYWVKPVESTNAVTQN